MAITLFCWRFIMRFLPMFVLALVLAFSVTAFAEAPLASPAGADKAAATHNEEGIKALNGGDAMAAEMHFREALKIAPRFARAHYNLGLALHAQVKHGPAADEFRKAKELDPKDKQIVDSDTLKTHIAKH